MFKFEIGSLNHNYDVGAASNICNIPTSFPQIDRVIPEARGSTTKERGVRLVVRCDISKRSINVNRKMRGSPHGKLQHRRTLLPTVPNCVLSPLDWVTQSEVVTWLVAYRRRWHNGEWNYFQWTKTFPIAKVFP